MSTAAKMLSPSQRIILVKPGVFPMRYTCRGESTMASAKAVAARETLFTALGVSMTIAFPTLRLIFWGAVTSSLITDSFAIASLGIIVYAETINMIINKAPQCSLFIMALFAPFLEFHFIDFMAFDQLD